MWLMLILKTLLAHVCLPTRVNGLSSGQSYKQFTIIIYNSRAIIWGNFKSGTTLES